MLAVPLASLSLQAAPQTELSVGIVPQQAASALAKNWIPLLAEAGRRAGVTLVFKTAPDIPSFESRLEKGEYDFAYMNPYHYTVFSKAPGYQAIAREKGRRLVGIVVVPKNSPAQSVADLAGLDIAFPAPAAFAASILPRAEFLRKNVPIKAHFVSSHDSVYRGVAQGRFAAGGGIKRTLEAMDPAISAQLRILTVTPDYTPHALAAHPRVNAALVRKLTDALLLLDADEAGKSLLQPLSFKGFEAAQDTDWDEIRQLKLTIPVGIGAKPAN
jgi:phosphonate transport system substrate-binding protein